MTKKTTDLLDQLEKKLETLPEAEQEAYVGALLEALRHRKQDRSEGETTTPSLSRHPPAVADRRAPF